MKLSVPGLDYKSGVGHPTKWIWKNKMAGKTRRSSLWKNVVHYRGKMLKKNSTVYQELLKLIRMLSMGGFLKYMVHSKTVNM